MTRALAIAVLAVFAAACGPSTKPAGATPDPAPTNPLPEPEPEPEPALDRSARCTRLVDHMFDVALSEHPGTDPAEIRKAMSGDRDRLIGDCTGGAITNAEYDCAIAATTAAEMQTCASR